MTLVENPLTRAILRLFQADCNLPGLRRVELSPRAAVLYSPSPSYNN